MDPIRSRTDSTCEVLLVSRGTVQVLDVGLDELLTVSACLQIREAAV